MEKRWSASHRAEHLENRTLLTGPELVAVSPNVGMFIQDGTTVTERPQELVFQFSPGQVIDGTTLGAIQITGSGFDNTFSDGNEISITPGFRGIGDNPDQVVFRFASPLQDDQYMISIRGTGAAPLTNDAGEAFLDGADETLTFDLNLGAEVRAVVPQPVVREQDVSVLDVAQISDGDTITINDGARDIVFEFEDTASLNGSSSDAEVQYNSTTSTDIDVANALLAAINGATFFGDGVTASLSSPTTVTVTGNSQNATVSIQTTNAGAMDAAAGGITQHRDRIIVHFNPDTLDQASAETVTFYQLVDTNDTVAQADDATINPTSVRYDADNNVAVLTFAGDIAVGTHRLRIGTDAAPTTFTVDPTVFNDDNSSFATANTLGTIGAVGTQLSAAIEPQTGIPIPVYPGGSDEPGHREIPAESHGAGSGVFSTAPDDIRVIAYYFPEIYGTNLQNQPLINEITENQKQRTREVFEIFSSLYGFETVELEQTLDNAPVTPANIPPDQILSIVTGDIRAAAPEFPPLGVSIGGGGGVIINGAGSYGQSEFGGSWFETALHEIGHSIGLGHSFDLPSDQGNPTPAEDQYPGNHDIVHGRRIHRPDANDIDLYSFDVAEAGVFSAEVIAERLVDAVGNDDPSLLNSVLRLYRENADGSRELIAQNDDYFSNDSFIELELEAGNYFIGVSSTGNADYDPTISNTGSGGLTDGNYDLRLLFTPSAASQIVDTDGTALDGDADGTPGGVFEFDFRSDNTIFVDKLNDTAPGNEGAGTEADPFDTIQQAINAATAGDIIRVVANPGDDNDLSTITDNRPYLVGLDDSLTALPDGDALNVPGDVVLQIDPGATIKLQAANIDAGTTSLGNDRSGAAIQILGTPEHEVILTAYGNDAIGGDSDGVTDGANAGDWGGVTFREDSDFQAADAAANPGAPGIFLNYVNHARISFGGGEVAVDSVDGIYTPVHLVSARPTITNNTITNSAKGAMSANPDSFDDSRGRIGPDIHGNLLQDNSTNGIIFRIDTQFGEPIDRLSVPARLDDTDITHVITENLEIIGSPGGPIARLDGSTEARLSGRLAIDPGVVVKLGASRIEALRGNAHVIAEGTEENPVIFTSILDDRYGAGGSFDTTGNGNAQGPAPGDWAGLVFNANSRGSIDQAIISYAGGNSAVAGGSGSFNPIEVLHRADLRLANSIIENNADGIVAGSDQTRDNRGTHSPAVVFVRQAQPVILNNIFRNNEGSVVHINANAITSEFISDPGRSTGPIGSFPQFAGNQGPLVRLNRMDNNSINGMEVRGEALTTESVWDDTDIVHVLRGEIIVDHHHTYSGIRLESSATESLVVKLDGNNAGFTASGTLLDIEDRIGGTVQVVGQPLFPVILTSLQDDSIGASLKPDGFPQTDTDNGTTAAAPGDWRGILFDHLSNDRNVRVINERESANNAGIEANGTNGTARVIGELAPDYKSGDENRALGFDIHGSISADDPGDIDVYSFQAVAGTEVWFDLDMTAGALAPVIELVELNGTVNARAVFNDGTGMLDITSPSGNLTMPTELGGLTLNAFDGGDHYSTNFRDSGFRAVLPGTGTQKRTYFVRVRSNSANLNALDGGLTSGEYQLQIRLNQVNEKSGSTVRFADVRFATDAIHVQGLPSHSPLVGETAEVDDAPSAAGSTGQFVGNLLETDRNVISIAGELSPIPQNEDGVDAYNFRLDYATIPDGTNNPPGSIQSIPGVNRGGKSWSTVFDLDYSDNLTRSDATLIVFDEATGAPVLIGRDSNIDADQPTGLPGDGNSFDDLTRGSAGVLDPFIGPVQLPAGNPGDTTPYTVAVTSNGQLVSQLDQTYVANATNPLVRLEPVSSTERIIEDHIGFEGYTSNGALVLPTNENADNTTGLLFPNLADVNTLSTNQTYTSPSSGVELPTNIRPFDLSDVPLFISTTDTFRAVNPFQGRVVNDISGNFDDSNNNLQTVRDIVMRSDGFLYGYRDQRNINGGNQGTNDTVGQLVRINPATGELTAVGNDNIPGRSQTQVTQAADFEDATISDRVGAVTFDRNASANNGANYVAYYAVHENSSQGLHPNSKLYRANATTGAVANAAGDTGFGDIQLAGVTYAFTNISVRNNGTPAVTSRVVVQSRAPGPDGNNITVNLSYGTNTSLDVTVTGTTINVRVDDGNNAGQIAAAINADPDANQLVTAMVALNDNSGTQANNATSPLFGGGALTGGIGTPLRGNVTGLSFGGFYGSAQGTTAQRQLYGITDAGELISINTSTGQATMVYDLAGDPNLAGLNTNFVGLALGPQNVSEFDVAGVATPSRYANLLFALANDGTMIALDPADAGGVGNILQPIFDTDDDGLADADRINIGITGATGLAFSPLDFNLWHPTQRRSGEAGHGINQSFDNLRTPSDERRTSADGLTDGRGNNNYNHDEDVGGTSLYFGLEAYDDIGNTDYYNYESSRGQIGVRNHDIQRDLTDNNPSIGNNYNLPGGAKGSLVTAPFDLVSQFGNEESADRPVLYFNYFLESEDTNESDPSANGSARDTARVFISNDGGTTWELIATNNSSRDDDSELPTYSSHSRFADASDGRQAAQELFDNTGTWRQARIDLSDYVGDTGLMLRFDFTTSGSMNDPSLRTGLGTQTDLYGEYFTETTDAQPSANNDHEGFYVDDIIIGWAERGEMITGASNNRQFFNVPSDPDPTAPDQILTGNYQLEIRRGYEYAAPTSPTDPEYAISDAAVPDTNAQFVPGANLNLGGGLNIDFDTPASFDVLNLTVDDSSRPQWSIDTLSGSPAIKTQADPADTSLGLIAPDTEATMTITVTTGEGFLEFDRLFQPEAGRDTFQVYIDGTAIAAADFEFTGTDAAPVHTQIPISAGAHRVTFVHKKNASGTAGLGQLTIDNIQFPAIGGYLRGDRNVRREQGLFEIANNIILDAGQYGIRVDAGARDAGTNNPNPGSPINFETPNDDRLVPGAVIQNNIVSRSGTAGIRFGGEPTTTGVPVAAVPFGKIINNTIVGSTDGTTASGIGIQVVNNASPTLLNNIVAETTTGISVDGTSSAVIERTHFYRNTSDGSAGQNPLIVARADASPPPLFVDSSTDNYYLMFGSQAIDRSRGSVPDRTAFIAVKQDLGIPPSDTFSPSRDLFGQLRQDDTSSPGPGSGGESFNDIGAVERADFIGPFATLVTPLDGGVLDLDPQNHDVIRILTTFLPRFVVKLNDTGIGVDDLFVTAAQWELKQDGRVLTEGVDYRFVYNTATNEAIFQAVTAFATDSRYTITLIDRSTATGVRDLAGNLIQANRSNGDVRFEIALDNNVNDAPVNIIPDMVMMNEDSDPDPLVFSNANGNAILVTDTDAILGNNELTVTLFAEHGTLVVPPFISTNDTGSMITFPDADTVTGQSFTVIDSRDAANIDEVRFTFVDAAVTPAPSATEIAVNAGDAADVVAANAATVMSAILGAGMATAAADTVTFGTDIAAARLTTRNSNIGVTGSTTMTVIDDDGPTPLFGSTVIGEQFTFGVVQFTYVDANVVAVPALDQIAIDPGDTPGDVALATVAAINHVDLYGANTVSINGAEPDQIDVNPALTGLYFSNTDGTSLTVAATMSGFDITTPDGATVIGEELDFNGAIYRFVDLAAGAAGVQEIGVRTNFTASDVAEAMQAVLVADGVGGTLARSANVVSLTAGPVRTVLPLVLSGGQFTMPAPALALGDHISVNGTAFSLVDKLVVDADASEIGIQGAADAAEIATRTAAKLNAVFGAGTATVTGVNADIVEVTNVSVAGITPATGQAVVTLSGNIDLINQALDGLQFVPNQDYFGPASITLLTEDLGQFTFDPANRINQIDVDVIPIQIKPVNDNPTLDPIGDIPVDPMNPFVEDTDINMDTVNDLQTVNLTGITAGPINELEGLRVAAALVDTVNVAIAPGARVVGSTLTVNGVVFTYVDAAVVTSPSATEIAVDITAGSTFDAAAATAAVINAHPTVSTEVLAVAHENTVSLAQADRLTSPATTVSASSTDVFSISDQDDLLELIAPVNYVSPDETGTLQFRSRPNAFGIADIAVTVTDAGLDGIFDDDPGTAADESADNASFTQTFTVTVSADNDEPTMDAILPATGGQLVLDEMTAGVEQSVPLEGITVGPANELEDYRITAAAADTTIVTFAAGQHVIGETLTINGTAFTFVDITSGPTGNQIGVAATASTISVAQAAAAVINAAFPVVPPAVPFATASQNSVALTIDSAMVSATDTNAADTIDPFAIATQDDLITNLAVDFVSRTTGATLRFTPGNTQFGGPITITVTTEDAGVDGIFDDNMATARDEQLDNQQIARTFTVLLNPINDTPTIDPVSPNPVVITEDPDTAPMDGANDEISVSLSGITTGQVNELEDLDVTVRLESSTVVAFAIGANVIGEVLTVDGTAFTFVAAGTEMAATDIPVSADAATLATAASTDAVALAAESVINTVLGANTVRAFQHTISIQNTVPATPRITGNAPGAFVITDSSNIISTPQIDYVSRNSGGTVRFTPVGDQFGEVTVTVTVRDAGIDGIFNDDVTTVGIDESADNEETSRSFVIQITRDNDSPRMDEIDEQMTSEGAAEQSVALENIAAGPLNELEDVRITAQLRDTTTVAVAAGINVIGQSLSFDGTVFTFVDADVVPAPAATQIPVSIDDTTIDVAASAAQVINNLLGADTVVASTNTVNTTQAMTVVAGGPNAAEAFALMSATDIITAPVIDYTSRDTSGTLRYTPVGDGFGVVTVDVTTEDAGADGVFGTADDPTSITREFSITVDPVNDAPVTAQIADQTMIPEQSDQVSVEQTIDITGIRNADSSITNELEDIQVTAELVDTTIVVFAIGDYVIGETLTVAGTDFLFVNSTTTTPTGNQIGVAPTDSTFTVARAAAAAINAAFPATPPAAPLAAQFENSVALSIDSAMVSTTDTAPTDTIDPFAVFTQDDVITGLQVDYTTRDTTATLRYTPGDFNFGGPIGVRVTTKDFGVDGRLDDDPGTPNVIEIVDDGVLEQTFGITITPVNDAPTLNAISNLLIDPEDIDVTPADSVNDEQTVALSGISVGPANELEDYRITAVASDTTIVVFAAGTNIIGETLTINGTVFSFVSAVTGAANEILVAAGDSTVDVATAAAAAVNAAFPAAPMGSPFATAFRNSVALTVDSAQVSGSDEVDAFDISSQDDLITNLVVDFTTRAATANLRFTPGDNAFGGPVEIVVTVEDAGKDGLFNTGDENSFQRAFTVTVEPANDTPAMDAISDLVINGEDIDSSPADGTNDTLVVPISGISVGPDNELEDYRITVVAKDTTIVAVDSGANVVGETLTVNGTIFSYVGTATGALNQIVVDVSSDSTLDVAAKTAAAINAAFPAMPGFATAFRNSVAIKTARAMVTGSDEVHAFAIADQNDLITNLTPNFVSRTATASISFVPGVNQFGGPVEIEVTLRDAGVDGIFGPGDPMNDDLSFIRTFTVTVIPVNDDPTMDPFSPMTVGVNEDQDVSPADSVTDEQSISLTGITAGPANELEDVRLSSTVSEVTNVAFATGQRVINQTLTIADPTLGTTQFRFTATATGATTDIVVAASDTAIVVAGKAATAINAHFGSQVAVDFGTHYLTLVAASAVGSSIDAFAVSTHDRTLAPSSGSGVDGIDIDYTSPNTTGTLRFTPAADEFGMLPVTVTVTDAGTDGIFDDLPGTPANESLDNNSFDRTFLIDISPDNDAPTINTITAAAVDEQNVPAEQSVALSGITTGAANELEELEVTAVLENTNTIVFAAGGNLAGETLTIGGTVFTYSATATGAANEIVVTAGDSSLDVALLTAVAVNAAFPGQTATVSDNTITTPLTVGAPASPGKFTVVNSSQIISGLAVDYTSRESTGTIRYTPVANAFGQVTVTVTVTDGGFDGFVDGNGDRSTQQSFVITINSQNDDPLLNAIPDQSTTEDAGVQSVTLSGASAGWFNELEGLRLDVTLEDTVSVAVASADNVAAETLTVDDGTTTVIFTYVSAPTGGANEIVVASGGNAQSVAIATATAINAAFGADSATAAHNTFTTALNVTPSSTDVFSVINAADIVGGLAIDYTSPDTTAELRYALAAEGYGQATITVTVTDAGIDGIFDAADPSVQRSFTVTVAPVNDVPVLDAIADESKSETDGGQEQSLSLSGLFNAEAGVVDNEVEELQVTARLLDSNSIIVSAGAEVIGHTLTLSSTPTPTVFTYVDAAAVTSPTATQIPVQTTDTTQTVATATATVVNALLGAGTAVATDNTVTTALTATPSSASAFAVLTASEIVSNVSVDYTSPGQSGTLRYTPVVGAFGQVTVRVTAADAGFDDIFGAGDPNREAFEDFTITISPDNQAPTLDAVAASTTVEEGAEESVALAGITTGGANELENISVTAQILPTKSIAFAAGGRVSGRSLTIGTETFTFSNIATGATNEIVVGVGDSTQAVATAAAAVINGSLLGAGTVLVANNTITTTSDLPVSVSIGSEDAFAVMNSADIIGGLAVDYVSGDATGTLRYQPSAINFGQVMVRVTATDAGVDGIFDASELNVTRDFVITVAPQNDAPSVAPIADQTGVDEDDPEQTVALTGITSGVVNELEDIRITAVLEDTRALAVGIGSNVIGETVTLGGTVFTYVDAALVSAPTATEIPVNTGDSTSIVAIATADAVNAALGANSAVASGNTVNTALTVSTSSTTVFQVLNSNEIISNPVIDYTSPSDTATLRYTPVANGFGLVTVRVTVTDAGVDGLFGVDSDGINAMDRVFTIAVGTTNDPPTIDPVSAQIVNEDAGPQTVNLTGITTGDVKEVEDLRVSARVDDSWVLIVGSGARVDNQSISVDDGMGGTVEFVYVRESTGSATEIVIFNVDTLVTKDSTFEVAEATAEALNNFFGAGTAVVSGNTVNSYRQISTTSSTLQVASSHDVVTGVSTTYTSPDTTGTVSYTPVDDAFGVVWITVTVEDAGDDGVFGLGMDGSTSTTFPVFVNAVNDTPTLNGLSDLFIRVNNSSDASTAIQHTVNLSGITRGPVNEIHDLRITAVSSNPAVIPHPAVQYVSPDALGSLTFTAIADQAGAASITVTVEDAGVDGVFGDPLTSADEQADNLSVIRTFRVSTNPIVLSPAGVITDSTPLLSWTPISGTAAYDVELFNITENTSVNPGTSQTAATSLQITQPLPLGEYSFRVRAIDAIGNEGLWSDDAVFTVGLAPVITAPSVDRLPDSTPSFAWIAVPGADSYGITIVNDVTGETVFTQAGLTTTSFTIPETDALPLGRYRYTISASNVPSASSSGATVTAIAEGIITVSTPPEVLLPFVAIYDTTPTITWNEPVGTVVSDVEVFNVTTGLTEFVAEGVSGNEYTVPVAMQLTPGEYRTRVRSYGDAARTVDSDLSTVHVFQVGASPVLFGPSDSSGGTNLRQTVDPLPTLTWNGSLDGETYQVWLTDLTSGQAIHVVDGLETASFTPPQELPVGKYRYWVRAQTGTGERSAWSRSQDFQVVTPPVINTFAPSILDRTPTITWNAQQNVDSWQIWVNKVDEVPAVIIQVESGLTSPEYTLPNDLVDGRYKVWVRGFASSVNSVVGTLETQWSQGFEFEVGGRPVVTIPENTADTTPTLSWVEVPGAAGYEIYLADGSDIGTPLVRESGISATSYTVVNELAPGTYRFWVRSIRPDGTKSPWSLNSQSFISVQSVSRPVLNDTPDGSNGTPTITWQPAEGAVRYEVYISREATPGTAVIRVADISTTSFTPATALTPDDYRVWVRAISADNDLSRWSIHDDFSITLAGLDNREEQGTTLLVALSGSESEWAVEDVDVSDAESALPTEAEPAEFHTGWQTVAMEVVSPAEAEALPIEAEAGELPEFSDDLMAQWDSEIWAEESAVAHIDSEPQKQEASSGWLAGLAALTPSLFRRRSRKDD